MPSSGSANNRSPPTRRCPQTLSGFENAQARRMLRSLCRFLIPLVQSTTIQDVDRIRLGDDAAEFVVELEKFAHGKRQTRIKVRQRRPYRDPLDYMKGIKWFWEIHPVIGQRRLQDDQAHPPVIARTPMKIPKRRLEVWLPSHEDLQHKIYTSMPLRLLYFESLPDGLTISLLDRNSIYRLLAARFSLGLTDFDWINNATRYSILSHTWNQDPGELTFTDWQAGESVDVDDPKCQKLINFCKVSWEDYNISFGWIDTLCINKESSSELDESIRSMYKWYSNAEVCITYLAKTESLSEMHSDQWFNRGWTFQELVAPPMIKFYNKHWECLIPTSYNDKKDASILKCIETKTTMTKYELSHISKVSISRRMALAAQRSVTREEDTAYSLMGIFNVSISTAYGEGAARAFFRLLKEIFDTTKDITDIFNWGHKYMSGHHPKPVSWAAPWDQAYSSLVTSLFPPVPQGYGARSDHLPRWNPIEPFTLTHLGLRTPLLLMATKDETLASEFDIVGDFRASVSVSASYIGRKQTYSLFKTSSSGIEKMGILNVELHDNGESIRIPQVCLGVLLEGKLRSPGQYVKIDTWEPLVFNLERSTGVVEGSAAGTEQIIYSKEIDSDSEEERTRQLFYVVEKSQLATHGLELVTLYL